MTGVVQQPQLHTKSPPLPSWHTQQEQG